MIKIYYRRNRKVAAVEQKPENISYYCQKQFYKIANEGKTFEYGMDLLPEDF